MLSDKWGCKRPEELSPTDFINLTAELFGEEIQPIRESVNSAAAASAAANAVAMIGDGSGSVADSVGVTVTRGVDRSAYVSRPVWRKALFGASGSPTFGTTPPAEDK